MRNSKKGFKITFGIMIMAVMMMFFMGGNHDIIANAYVNVSGPSLVVEGQTIRFSILYNPNVKFIEINSVSLNGFSAQVEISGSGSTRYVTLKNVRGSGSNNSITVVGVGYIGNTKIGNATSNTFKIKTQAEINDQNKKPAPTPTPTPKPSKPDTTNQQPATPKQEEPKTEQPQKTQEPENKEAEEPKQEEPVKPVDPNKEPIPNTGK